MRSRRSKIGPGLSHLIAIATISISAKVSTKRMLAIRNSPDRLIGERGGTNCPASQKRGSTGNTLSTFKAAIRLPEAALFESILDFMRFLSI